MPEEDSHLSDQTRSQAHPSREFTRALAPAGCGPHGVGTEDAAGVPPSPTASSMNAYLKATSCSRS